MGVRIRSAPPVRHYVAFPRPACACAAHRRRRRLAISTRAPHGTTEAAFPGCPDAWTLRLPTFLSTLIFPLGAGFLGAALRVRSAAPITALPFPSSPPPIPAPPDRRRVELRRECELTRARAYGPARGCTETRAANFDALAAVDDGSCFLLGCTDSTQLGFDPEANLDDATCRTALSGCADVAAVNHWPMGTIDREDGPLPLHRLYRQRGARLQSVGD